MASKSKSGVNPERRERFMLDHGFVPLRTGKGSHAQWEHTELKLLARSHKIEAPANLLSNDAQNPWEITLSGDPGPGTWKAICKLAEWCQDKVGEIKNASAHEQLRCKVAREFRQAAHDYRAWKKQVKLQLRSGFNIAALAKPPVDYQKMLDLQAQKIQLSLPMR